MGIGIEYANLVPSYNKNSISLVHDITQTEIGGILQITSNHLMK